MAYELSKIYMIVSDLGTLKYIGSTKKKYLSSRLAGHIYDYFKFKKGLRPPISSFKLFDEYGIENCSIVLIENFSCQNNIELKERERHYIQTMECVNIQIPLRTHQEYRDQHKEQLKEWKLKNKEKIKEYNKKYRLSKKSKTTL